MAGSIPKTVRMSIEEHDTIQGHADKAGMSFSEWIRMRALEPPLPRPVWAYLQDWADEIDKPVSYVWQRLLVLIAGRCKGAERWKGRSKLHGQLNHLKAFEEQEEQARNETAKSG